MSKPKVLMVGAECYPFAKVGGLADVMGALPPALSKLGVDIRVLMPMHRVVKETHDKETELLLTMCVKVGSSNQCLSLKKLEHEGITYYMIDNKFHYGYCIYKGGDAEREQYAYLCRALLDFLPYLDFAPDILHLNDWQTAAIPLLMQLQYPQYTQKTMLTIHNLQYQGDLNCNLLEDLLDVDEQTCMDELLDIDGNGNMMKGGINFADVVTTVSPTYAEEILTEEFGCGLEKTLKKRKKDLYGILNGINTSEFDPAADPLIAANYDSSNLRKKRENKKELLEATNLDVEIDTPVIGMVTRLVDQKGLDILEKAMDELLNEEMGLVLLGNGDPSFEKYFDLVAKWSRGKVSVHIGYHDDLAHKIYAGSDFFLMPSKFEPCGLSQMIAQRYGTPPIVHSTGGLKDTVLGYDPQTGEGTGFCFDENTPEAMLEAVRQALLVYKDKNAMQKLIGNVMQLDHSFDRSAKEYLRIYEQMLAKKEEAI